MNVITVSRSYGSGGSEFARQLADQLGYHYVDEAFVRAVEDNAEQSSPLLASIEDEVGPGFLEKLTGFMSNRNFYKSALSLCLYELALKSDVVVVGAGGHLIFADYPSLISLQVVKKLSERVRSVARDRNLRVDDAVELVEDKDKAKAKFIENYFDRDLFDPLMFHLVMNFSLVPMEEAVQLVAHLSTTFPRSGDSGRSERWLKDRLIEKKAEMVLFHLGLTHGPMVEFQADGGRLLAKGVLGGKHEKERLLDALVRMSEVTGVTDELKVGVLSRMLY